MFGRRDLGTTPAPGGGTPPDGIVGRDAELAVADRFLDDAATGFAVLRIHGAPGIGKSTLWQETLHRARDRGHRTLECRPGEPEARLSLTALGDLLEQVPDGVLDALPAPQRHAVDVALLRADAEGAPVQDRVLATALRTALARLAADAPVVLAIDDVQWLDASSAAVIGFAVRRLGGERIGLLVAHRAGTSEPLALDRLEPARRHDLTPGPLTVGALHHVVKRHLGTAIPRSVFVRVHAASGGNPLFALEIARKLLATGAPRAGEPLPVPDDVRTMLATRIADLPAPTRRLLLAVAAGASAEPELASVLGRPVDDDLRAAEAQGLAHLADGRLAFAHPLFADAVYASASAADRRAIHRALAAATRDVEARARHLALAASGPDANVAAALEAAARRAESRGATGSAAELWELAWDRTPHEHREPRLRRRIEHASQLHAAGDTARAEALLEDVERAASPGAIRARARLELATLAHVSGTLQRSISMLEGALDDAAEDPELAAEIRAVLARLTPDLEEARMHAEAALAFVEATPDASPQITSHALVALAEWESRTRPNGLPSPEIIERALRHERAAPLPRVSDRFSAALGVWLKYGDDFAGARRWLEVTLQAALDEGDESTVPYVYSHLPQLELWAGNWIAAETLARHHLELAEASGQESQRRQALYNLGTVLVHQGREAEARRTIGEALAAATTDEDEWTEAICLAPMGLLEHSLGEPRVAIVALDRVSRIWRSLGDQSARRHESDLVEALVAVGELAAAQDLAADLGARAATLGRHSALATAARVRGIVAAATGDADAAVAAMAEALVHHDAVDIPFDRARTLLALGIVRRRRRERGLARDALAAALAAFERLGARLWAERTRGELDRLGLRRSAGHALTEAERRVAELAATGRTNREIAAALYMSPKTVDANLGRAYRKLGIGSRAELGAWHAGRQQT